MKHLLLICWLLPTLAFAQQFNTENRVNKDTPSNDQTSALRSTVSFVPIGTSYNLYTNLLAGQNMVSYHPDIETITFVHRQNNGTTGGSGGISFDHSTDGGITWNINQILTPSFNAGTSPEVAGCRYPSAAIFNPPGNTNPDNAFIFQHAAALAQSTGSWGLSSNLSMQLDGDFQEEAYYSKDGLVNDYLSLGLHYYSDNSLWDMKANVNWNTYTINKHLINFSTKQFELTEYTLTPDFAELAAEELASSAFYQVNFDPSGTIGYAIFIGAYESDPLKTMAPKGYKTIDGGLTWFEIAYVDWSAMEALHPYLEPTISDTSVRIPYFRDFDATVDSSGRLHIFIEMYSRIFENYLDMLYEYDESETSLWHLSTYGDADWQAHLIEEIPLSKTVYGSIEIGYRVQMSRTPDASKIFFCWSSSDATATTEHDAPDIWIKGCEVTSGLYTPDMNITEGTVYAEQAYFPSLAPTVKDLGGIYELPIVFTDPGPTDVSPAQFVYIQQAQLEDGMFAAEVAPVANFAAGTGTDVVSFTNTSLYATSYYWDFDDGFFSSLENPEHTFPGPGEYEVCLTATNAFGEDTYCANVVVAETCTEPTDIVTLMITSTWARFSWDSVPAAIKYQFQYRPMGSTTWLKKNTPINMVKIVGLAPATTYEYRAKTICDAEFSGYSPVQTFATLARIGEEGDTDLVIYPNPAHDWLMVQGLNQSEQEVKADLYDNTGRLVQSITTFNYGQTLEISLHSCIPGVYILHVTKGADTWQQAVVVD